MSYGETHAELELRRRYSEPTECDGRMKVIACLSKIYELRCERCGFEAAIPARQVNPDLIKQQHLEQAGFPTRFVGKHLDENEYNRSVLRELRSWLQRYPTKPVPAPAIWGDAGRGKTHILVALGERIVREQGAAVLFRSSARLLDEMQEAFDEPGDQSRVWHRALGVAVLILDDLGAERPTEWRADRLARLVDERWERELPIVLATNYSPKLWEQTFDARTVSRLRGMTCPIELRGRDARVVDLFADRAPEPTR